MCATASSNWALLSNDMIKKRIQISLVGIHDRVGEPITDGPGSGQKLPLLK